MERSDRTCRGLIKAKGGPRGPGEVLKDAGRSKHLGGLDPRWPGPGEDNTKEVRAFGSNEEEVWAIKSQTKGGLDQRWVKDEQRREGQQNSNNSANQQEL